MKKTSILLLIMCMVFLSGCSGNSLPGIPAPKPSAGTPESSAVILPVPDTSPVPAEGHTPEQSQKTDTIPLVTLQIGSKNFTAILYDNESARALAGEMPFTLYMDDYASQEKVTDLTFTLPPAVPEVPDTINAGELYLWSGSSFVLFYTTFSNTYSYVPIGYIEDVSELKEALGSGSVTVTFSIPE